MLPIHYLKIRTITDILTSFTFIKEEIQLGNKKISLYHNDQCFSYVRWKIHTVKFVVCNFKLEVSVLVHLKYYICWKCLFSVFNTDSMGSVIDTVVSIYMQMFWIITSLQNSKEKKTRKFNDLVFYSNGYWLSPGRVLQGFTELSTLKIFLKQRNNCQLSNNQWQKHGTWIYVPSPTSCYTWVYWIWNFKDSQFTCKVVGKVKKLLKLKLLIYKQIMILHISLI